MIAQEPATQALGTRPVSKRIKQKWVFKHQVQTKGEETAEPGRSAISKQGLSVPSRWSD